MEQCRGVMSPFFHVGLLHVARGLGNNPIIPNLMVMQCVGWQYAPFSMLACCLRLFNLQLQVFRASHMVCRLLILHRIPI